MEQQQSEQAQQSQAGVAPYVPVNLGDAPTLTEADLVAAIKDSLSISTGTAVRAGVFLLEAKKRHGKHGEWLPWLLNNSATTERTAQRYMRLASPSKKSDTVSYLRDESVRAASRLVDRPKPAETYCCPECGHTWDGHPRPRRRVVPVKPTDHVEQEARTA